MQNSSLLTEAAQMSKFNYAHYLPPSLALEYTRSIQQYDSYYSWAKDTLCTLPQNCLTTTIKDNLALIKMLGQPVVAINILRQILDDRQLLKEVASRSYRHTNHFDKIVVIDSGNNLGYRLTLHLWNPPYSEQETQDEQIHDHRFSFWSSVLVGRIVFQNYARDASGTIFNEYQYIPEKRDLATMRNFYIDVGGSPLLEGAPTKGKTGDVYHLPYNCIHRVVLPSSEMTCTLVLRGPRQKNYASVFSNSRKYDPSQNIMFSPDALSEKLLLILENFKE